MSWEVSTLVAVASLLTACGGTVDMGGEASRYYAEIARADAAGEVVVTPDRCASACLILLGAKRVKLSANAQIGVHEVRVAGPGNNDRERYASGKFSWHGTLALQAAMLPCARALMAPAMSGARVTWFSGAHLRTACPGEFE